MGKVRHNNSGVDHPGNSLFSVIPANKRGNIIKGGKVVDGKDKPVDIKPEKPVQA
jgi:hypothetical protein